MQIESVRHDWPEAAGFTISRPSGYPLYTFLHLQTPISIEIDGKIINTRPGACIFIAPGVPQYFYASDPLIHNWIHIDADLGIWLQKYGLPENRLFYPNETDFISQLFQKIEAEHFGDNPHKEALLEHYLHSFLILLSRSLQGVVPPIEAHQPEKLQMRAIRKSILSQPGKHWTVAEMADMAAMSVSRFHIAYKAYFGTSPIQDVKEAKLRFAMTLLCTRMDLSVFQIAQELGYENACHFIRIFKATYGISPGEYRKTLKMI